MRISLKSGVVRVLERRRSAPIAAVASVAAVIVVTGAIFALRTFVPVLSLGVLYVFAVLPVAVLYGLAFALPVSVLSMLALNWFFLPPMHTFTLADRRNWAALVVYLGTAVVVSELAAGMRRRADEARQREREAQLLAEVSSLLIEHGDVQPRLREISARIGRALGSERAWIELGSLRRAQREEAGYNLDVGGRHVGRLFLDRGIDLPPGTVARLFPGIASALAVAVDREELARQAVETESLRRSDLLKTAILRAVSHDLRTPLTGIRTAIGALRNETLSLSDADRLELHETIDVEAARLARLVGDLLDLSRLQAGSAVPEPEVWSLDDLVREVVEMVGARGRVEVKVVRTPLVNVDAAQIERVLANLVENALKFSGDRPVHVQLTATRREALARVVDQGAGIGEEALERVFEPFYRGADDAGSGAGLGLAIARGFAEANGGRLWVESRPGQGATFVLALPLVEVPAELSA